MFLLLYLGHFPKSVVLEWRDQAQWVLSTTIGEDYYEQFTPTQRTKCRYLKSFCATVIIVYFCGSLWNGGFLIHTSLISPNVFIGVSFLVWYIINLSNKVEIFWLKTSLSGLQELLSLRNKYFCPDWIQEKQLCITNLDGVGPIYNRPTID